MKRNLNICPKCFSSCLYNISDYNPFDESEKVFWCEKCRRKCFEIIDAISETKSIEDIINHKIKTCFPIDIIPNQMGINLCSVDSIEEIRLEDRQLTEVIIHFIPNIER